MHEENEEEEEEARADRREEKQEEWVTRKSNGERRTGQMEMEMEKRESGWDLAVEREGPCGTRRPFWRTASIGGRFESPRA